MIIDEVLGKAPPECQTHSEKIAFAFGWFKAMEQIEAVVLAEREACAKVCEEGVDTEHPIVKGHIMKNFGISEHLAAAIRARGNK